MRAVSSCVLIDLFGQLENKDTPRIDVKFLQFSDFRNCKLARPISNCILLLVVAQVFKLTHCDVTNGTLASPSAAIFELCLQWTLQIDR